MSLRRRRRQGVRWLAVLAMAALAACFAVRAGSESYYRMAYPVRYLEMVQRGGRAGGGGRCPGRVGRCCREFSVEPALCYAVIRTESSFDPAATSSIGARGLMQLTEDTFDWVKSRLEPEADTGYDAMYDPEANIRYGAYLLAALEEQFGGERNALCAYHAGWGNATAWLADPACSAGGEIRTIPFADTAAYVEKVLATRDVYRELYGDALL